MRSVDPIADGDRGFTSGRTFSKKRLKMPERYKTVLLFGGPGVGKGTQGKIINSIPGFVHFATGDMFRSIDKNSTYGKTFYEYSSRGELVPDAVTVGVWAESVEARIKTGSYKPGEDLLILDGIPRTVEQGRIMLEYIAVLKIAHLVCESSDIALARLRLRAVKEGRADDGDENVIRKRWSVYQRETAPLLDSYPKDLITEVDSVGTPAQVLLRTLRVVESVHRRNFNE